MCISSPLTVTRKNRVWEQDAYDIQPDGSFVAHRKGSDDAEELGGLLAEEKSNQRSGRTLLIDEEDVICVEMMRFGGCLAPKTNSFSEHSRNESILRSRSKNDHPEGFTKPKASGTASTSTSVGTSATSFLLSLDSSRNSFPNSPHLQEYMQPSTLPPVRYSQQHENEALSRVSEYSDDFSSARTVAWDRRTFETQHHRNEQSYTDEQSTEGMNRVTFNDDIIENNPYPSEISEEVLLSNFFFLKIFRHLEFVVAPWDKSMNGVALLRIILIMVLQCLSYWESY